MPRRSFAYSITLSQVGPVSDPDFLRAPKRVKDEVKRWVVIYGLKEKDADLAAGLDKDGRPLTPVTAATRENRDSAMGPADPNAPALMPAYAVSRTRLLLEGEPTRDGAHFWWGYDAHTGGSWGKILNYQRRGVGKRKTVRDVIGISDAAVSRIRSQVLARWLAWKRAGLVEGWSPGKAPAVPAPRVLAAAGAGAGATRGRTDYQNFTYGIGGDGAPKPGQTVTGFFQRRPGQGFTAFGGPNPPRPGRNGGGPAAPVAPPPPKPKPKPKPRPKPKPAPKPQPSAIDRAVSEVEDARQAQRRAGGVKGATLAERINRYELGDAKARAVVAVADDRDQRREAAKKLWLGLERKLERAETKLTPAEQAETRAALKRARDEWLGLERLTARKILEAVLGDDGGLKFSADAVPGGFANVRGEKLSAPGPAEAARAKEAAEFLSGLFAPGDSPRVKARIGVLKGARPHAQEDLDYVQVSPDEWVDSYVHEFGHVLEDKLVTRGKSLKELAREFLGHRVGSEPPTSLKTKFGGGYRDDEFGRKDRFDRLFPEEKAYYVGKAYEDGSTEVVSMGLQLLYTDPVRFARLDPEYFKFIVGIADGSLR